MSQDADFTVEEEPLQSEGKDGAVLRAPSDRSFRSQKPWLLLPLAAMLLAGLLWTTGQHPAGAPCVGRQSCAGKKVTGPTTRLPPLPKLPGREPPEMAAELGSLPLEAARAANLAAPFIKGPVQAARPFRAELSPMNRARAVDCLAAAQLYEAGQDIDGQKAVAQVVLNRARHPAFPRTICGVVFEGAERATGCQFTFTCDGALARRYSASAWEAARRLATQFLDGRTDPRVGWATHYHTDWVYPYWSPSLDKLSAIGTHLFFRWRGFWGTSPAFVERYTGDEPVIAKLIPALPSIAPEAVMLDVDPNAADDDALPAAGPAVAAAPPPPPLPAGVSVAALRGNIVRLVHPDGGAYALLLRPGAGAEELMGVALRLCRNESVCRVMGWWSAAALPRGFPVPAASLAQMSFSFIRDARNRKEDVRFDCRRLPRAAEGQCL